MNIVLSKLAAAAKVALLFVVLVPFAAFADSGFYLGASAGSATLQASIDDIVIPDLPTGIDEDETGYKVFLGYNFDLPVVNLGIEGGYVNFGEPSIDILNEELLIETSGVNLWGIIGVDIGPVELFGKLGYLSWDIEAQIVDDKLTDDGADMGYGVGLGVNISKIQLRAEYEVYELDDVDLSMVSVGIAFRF